MPKPSAAKELNANDSRFFEGAMSKLKVVRTVKAAKGTSKTNSVRLDVPITSNTIAERETGPIVSIGGSADGIHSHHSPYPYAGKIERHM